MPAPNVAILFDFETPFEDVLTARFTGLGVFAQVVNPRTPKEEAEHLVTPRLQIRAGMLGNPSAGQGLQANDAPDGSEYLSYQSLGMTLDVVTNRSDPAQPHGYFRGLVRAAMLDGAGALDSGKLPNYETKFITPLSSTQVIDPANDEIQTQLAYQIDFWIPPTSFP